MLKLHDFIFFRYLYLACTLFKLKWHNVIGDSILNLKIGEFFGEYKWELRDCPDFTASQSRYLSVCRSSILKMWHIKQLIFSIKKCYIKFMTNAGLSFWTDCRWKSSVESISDWLFLHQSYKIKIKIFHLMLQTWMFSVCYSNFDWLMA